MAESFDHDRVDDLSRLLEELDCGTIEAMDQLDEDVLQKLMDELGSREEVERLWDLLRGGDREAR